MHSLIIFASGKGSNAKAIIDHFRNRADIQIPLIITNKQNAGVLDIAASEGIDSMVIDRNKFTDAAFISELQQYNPTYIILAGFLWKIPQGMVNSFPNRIINIHPALLPSYGGKGMYGHHVHEAVINAGEQESGISIHYVNEVYDSGDIIVQARCKVHADDTADSLAVRIHSLEHFYYPRTIEFLLQSGD